MYRKMHKIDSSGFSTATEFAYGVFGLKSISGGRLTEKQLEAARKCINRVIKSKAGVLFVRSMHKLPVTKKPLETRMGSGKGGVDHYVYNVKKGFMMFEIAGVSEDVARDAFTRAGCKLPFELNFVARNFVY